MKFILLRYGHEAMELHMEQVDRIIAENDVVQVCYYSGQVIKGHMIRVEQ